MVTACDCYALNLVPNEPNLFVRYKKLHEIYQEPNISLAKIALLHTDNAPVTLHPLGYRGNPPEKHFLSFKIEWNTTEQSQPK